LVGLPGKLGKLGELGKLAHTVPLMVANSTSIEVSDRGEVSSDPTPFGEVDDLDEMDALEAPSGDPEFMDGSITPGCSCWLSLLLLLLLLPSSVN
jgi:hypothetical protein